MSGITLTEGTQTNVATDLVGTTNYQIVKIDFGTAGTTSLFGGNSNPLPVNLAGLLFGEDSTYGVIGIQQKPVPGATYSPSEYVNNGTVTGTIVLGTAGNLYSAYVTSGTTGIRYFQLFNQGTAPILGQTSVVSYTLGSVPAGGIYELNLGVNHFAPSRYFSTGIAWAISSTDGTLGTASVTAADYHVVLKYLTT